MLRYSFAVTDARHDPLPPAGDLQTIEATSPEDALAKLERRRFVGEVGQTEAWLRVVVAFHPDGAPKYVLSKQVQMRPLGPDN